MIGPCAKKKCGSSVIGCPVDHQAEIKVRQVNAENANAARTLRMASMMKARPQTDTVVPTKLPFTMGVIADAIVATAMPRITGGVGSSLNATFVRETLVMASRRQKGNAMKPVSRARETLTMT